MERKWWKEAIAYQVYVRSFKDSNNDGIGDLQGLIEKLDYLKDLGIDIIYLNPINKSPNYDNGYDISDFRDIMDEFGTMEDFDKLIHELRNRDMHFIMDLVVNHTSHLHPWFIESRKSLDNPYRDYYIWHPGKDGNPPNNWGSFFGGSAWEYDEATGEYYLHIFSKEQPDLNWNNKKMREEIKDMLKFWLDKGVDGVRMDAINHLAKDHSFPDGPAKEGDLYGDFIKYVQNLPEVHNYIKEIREDVFKNNDLVLMGETGGISYHNTHLYTGDDRNELHMTFHFDMNGIGKSHVPTEKGTVDLKELKKKMSGWQLISEDAGWCPLFYSNHDSTRTVSRIGDDEKYWKESAKMLAALQFTQKGTPFVYYGDEIGMTNAHGFKLEDFRDVAIFNRYKDFVESGLKTEEEFLIELHYNARDNSRTPMQWNSSENADFTTATPWIKVNENHKTINVQQQLSDETSILSFYKAVIKLRKEHLSLVYGSFVELYNEHPSIYSYIRELEGERILVVTNFFTEEATFSLPEDIKYDKANLMLGNYPTEETDLSNILLSPYEARIYKLF
jgi:oligo-1,6-glucosidase